MPRYFFNIIDDTPMLDEEGTELADLAAARRAATAILADQLRGSGENFWQARNWRLEITDTTGTVLAALQTTAKHIVG